MKQVYFIGIGLFVAGACFGSFVNALVWRLREQEKSKKKKVNPDLSIVNGRSICPDCNHRLAWYDLIPIFSWLWLRGKCRYCSKPISRQYPIVELVAGLIFSLSYVFWPIDLSSDGQVLLLTTWLAASVGLLALAVYDLKWLLLPNRIIYPTLAVAAMGRLAYIIGFADEPAKDVVLWVASVVVASGIFYLLFIVSKGKWIGFGDVRLGLITGTLLATPQKSLAMIFIASLIGTLVILPALISGKKSMTSRLPYGPFLIAATAIVFIFGDSLINWYKDLLL